MDTKKKENTLLNKIKSKVMTKKFMTIVTIICGIIAAGVIIWRKVTSDASGTVSDNSQ